MRNPRKLSPLLSLAATLAASTLLYFLLFRPAQALETFHIWTTCEDFGANGHYLVCGPHGDGALQLMPIGGDWPAWSPGNNTGLPPRAGMGVAAYDRYLYVAGGDEVYGDTRNEVYYTTISEVPTVSERLGDWMETTPLPTSTYPYGVEYMEAVALNGYLYVMGGMTVEGLGADYADIVYAQIQPDGSLGEWQANAVSLPHPLYGMESAVLYGHIYLLGGADETGASRREVYLFTQDAGTGQLTLSTTTPLPLIGGTPIYLESSVAVAQGRIYVFGGAESSVCSEPSCLSPYVHFARPLSSTGEITSSGWILANASLPHTSYASEGVGDDAGRVALVSGAWDNASVPSPEVPVSLLGADGEPGQFTWSNPLSSGRFFHGVVQDQWGWAYSIGGATGLGAGGERLNEVQVARPYSRQARSLGQAPEAIYVPTGSWISYLVPITPRPGVTTTLTSLSWGATISNPEEMTVTLSYRYKDGSSWSQWLGPFPSAPGSGDVTTTLALSTSCDYVQFRAYLTGTAEITAGTTVTETPYLDWIRVDFEAPPDLVADDLTVGGGGAVPLGEPVEIYFTVSNQGSDVPEGENLYAMLFITTNPDYVPAPPDLPAGCENYPAEPCALIWAIQGYQLPEGGSLVLSTTYTMTVPGVYYATGYIDYSDTSIDPWYDIAEDNETNNSRVISFRAGEIRVYLPVILKNAP